MNLHVLLLASIPLLLCFAFIAFESPFDRLILLAGQRKRTFPEPKSRFIWASSFLSFAVLILAPAALVTFFEVREGHLEQVSRELAVAIFQAVAGLLAISTSALLIATQFTTEKYSSAVIPRSREHLASYASVKLQLASVIYLGLALVTPSVKAESPQMMPAVTFYLGVLLCLVAFGSVVPSIVIAIQRLRPQGVALESQLRAQRIVRNIRRLLPWFGLVQTKFGNPDWLRWNMLVLRDSILTLRSIGITAVREGNDEIVRIVLRAFEVILRDYFAAAKRWGSGNPDARKYRGLWDVELSDDLLLTFESEVTSLPSLGKEYSQFWLEQNILSSAATMLLESNRRNCEAHLLIDRFYLNLEKTYETYCTEADLPVDLMLRLVSFDFLLIFNASLGKLPDSTTLQTQKTCHNIIETWLTLALADPESAPAQELDRLTSYVSRFYSAVGQITLPLNSYAVVGNWLLLAENAYRESSGKLQKASDAGKLNNLRRSFARVYLDLLVAALLMKQHTSAKAVIQNLVFSQDNNLTGSFFEVAKTMLENSLQGANHGSYFQPYQIRAEKVFYMLAKAVAVCASYALYIEKEGLARTQSNALAHLSAINSSSAGPELKKHILPHLEEDVLAYLMHRLGEPMAKESAVKGAITAVFSELQK